MLPTSMYKTNLLKVLPDAAVHLEQKRHTHGTEGAAASCGGFMQPASKRASSMSVPASSATERKSPPHH